MWKIPLFDTSFGDEEIRAVQQVIASGWISMGEITTRLEAEFAEMVGTKYAVAVTNCTAALHLAMLSLDIGPGDEVICPSLSFVAGANSIIYTGAQPVFAEIQSESDLTIAPKDIATKITSKTKAVQVMHYGGSPCDMKPIQDLARKYNLYLIEDCAHAPGALYDGVRCGAIGDVGCFSFFSNKNMTTAEGGILTTNNAPIAETVKRMRSHGMTTLSWERSKGHAFTYDVVKPGFNYRIDDIRSAMGRVQLLKLGQNNAQRLMLVNTYTEALAALDRITIPPVGLHGVSACHIFPIVLDPTIDRNDFMVYLKSHGIQTSIHYPPIHRFSYFRNRFNGNINLPLTEDVSSREVTLPLYPRMSNADIEYIANKIKAYLKDKTSVKHK